MPILSNVRALVESVRQAPARGRLDCTLLIFGRTCRMMATPRLGPGPRRSVALVGIDTATEKWSVMVQRYAEGCELPAHLDGRNLSNEILWVLLWRAAKGGETFVEGPARRWLGGRVMRFDGGRHMHGVTKVERGSRISLILQRGRYDRARTGKA